MLEQNDRYESIDKPFFLSRIAPLLPEKILDFHAHIWKPGHWEKLPEEFSGPGGKYMRTTADYGAEKLISDGKRLFPGFEYGAVCFGLPTPLCRIQASNTYAAEAGKYPRMFPLMLAGANMYPPEELEKLLLENKFSGFKVFLPWHGDDYGKWTVEGLIGPDEMAIADKHGLIVLLHVPGRERLADSGVQKSIRRYSSEYPRARIVLAHCGRCYHPDEMRRAITAVRDLENVYLDTSMVMEPGVFHIIFSEINSSRVLFGTDFPVAKMRGRRVYVMDHWVDLVTEGYPESKYRVSGSNFQATFMAYEIILAISRAAETSGLPGRTLKSIFFDNGMQLIKQAEKRRKTP